jgi:hypothetical protein
MNRLPRRFLREFAGARMKINHRLSQNRNDAAPRAKAKTL